MSVISSHFDFEGMNLVLILPDSDHSHLSLQVQYAGIDLIIDKIV